WTTRRRTARCCRSSRTPARGRPTSGRSGAANRCCAPRSACGPRAADMLVTLDTPYLDTTAADLRFALGLPPQPALRTLEVELPCGETVVLRLLGASHQVRFRDVDETVACLPSLTSELPEKYDFSGYTFAASVRRLDRAAFAAACAELRQRAEREE